jgi:hypothetical protein
VETDDNSRALRQTIGIPDRQCFADPFQQDSHDATMWFLDSDSIHEIFAIYRLATLKE